MKRKIIDISTDEKKKEVYSIFDSLTSKNQIHKYFGISDNKSGSEYIKNIANEIGFDLNIYKERKIKPKKYCLQCGNEIFKRWNKKFCSQSCSAKYINSHRKLSDKAKENISKGLKKYYSENPKKIKRKKIKRNKEENNKPIKKYVKKRASSKWNCLQCGTELTTDKRHNKFFCSNECCARYRHIQSYKYYLKHQDEYCRANYTPKAFYDIFLEEQHHKCALCPQTDMHNGKRLRFVIDHIDGDASNNHRNNLRLVCPNCDSQLPTFKSKNKNSKRRNYFREKIIRNLTENKD